MSSELTERPAAALRLSLSAGDPTLGISALLAPQGALCRVMTAGVCVGGGARDTCHPRRAGTSVCGCLAPSGSAKVCHTTQGPGVSEQTRDSHSAAHAARHEMCTSAPTGGDLPLPGGEAEESEQSGTCLGSAERRLRSRGQEEEAIRAQGHPTGIFAKKTAKSHRPSPFLVRQEARSLSPKDRPGRAGRRAAERPAGHLPSQRPASK